MFIVGILLHNLYSLDVYLLYDNLLTLITLESNLHQGAL